SRCRLSLSCGRRPLLRAEQPAKRTRATRRQTSAGLQPDAFLVEESLPPRASKAGRSALRVDEDLALHAPGGQLVESAGHVRERPYRVEHLFAEVRGGKDVDRDGDVVGSDQRV